MKRTKQLLFLLFTCTITYGQIDYDKVPDVTSTYLLNDVHIIKSATDSFGLGDILISDGAIQQISREITPPLDAQVIEMDSAYAYPAFIDGLSSTGIPKSEKKPGGRPDVKFPGAPPNKIAGITPEQKAAELISTKESSIKSLREAGFGISHIVPNGKMLPGTGAIISLLDGDAEDLVIKEQSSIYMQFSGSRGIYPATVIGVMAKWRDLYKNTELLSDHRNLFKQSSTGLQRPKKNKTLQALIPLTKKEMALFSKTAKPKSIFRALELKRELGYNLVLTGVQYAEPALNKIKRSGAQVLLSTKLPKQEKDKKAKKGKKREGEKPKKEEGKKKKGKEDTEKTAEQIALEKRKKETYEKYLGQAAALEKEGVVFGFAMMDQKASEVKKNIKKMIDSGLSEKSALAALTSNTAKILGIDNLVGTLSPGKFANIMISTKPYFQDESAIKYMFVEGKMYKMEVKKKKPAGESAEGDVSAMLVGKWRYEVEVPGQTEAGTLTIDADGVVKLENDSDPGEVEEADNVNIDGDNVTFSMSMSEGGMDMILDFDLNFTEESFEGSVSVGEFGSFPISGTKASSPE